MLESFPMLDNAAEIPFGCYVYLQVKMRKKGGAPEGTVEF